MRFPYEIYNVVAGQALSGTVTLNKELPTTGETWAKIRIMLHLTTTHASEAYPFELAGYYFIKNVVMTLDGRQAVQAPGAALYWLNALARGKAPYHKNVLAAAATYDYCLDVPFRYPQFNRRAEDFFVDSGAYSSIMLSIQAGSIADIFATVSTAAVSCTMDVSIYRTKAGMYGAKGKPVFEPWIKAYPQISTSASSYWDIEGNPNLSLLGFYILSGNSAAAPFFQNGGSNGAWGGVDAWDKVGLADNSAIPILASVPALHFAETRNDLIPYLNTFGGGSNVQAPTLVGLQPHVFTGDGSSYSMYYTGGKGQPRIKSDSITASDYSDLLVFGGRKIKRDANGRYLGLVA
jgi:hypothetical protein